jgi:hypothetical protein
MRASALVFASSLTVLVIACGGSVDANGEDAGVASGASAVGDASASADASHAKAALTCGQTSCAEQKCVPSRGDGNCMRLECGGVALCEGAGRRCILEALRDGKQGRLEWRTSTSYLHQFYVVATIGSGRVGSGRWEEAYDSPSGGASFTQLPLKPASYFEACLAADDPDAGTSDEVQECLRNAFDACR